MLYLRMALTVIVGLYTSRVVLSMLGEVDYGLFNLVGGVIGFLGFLNLALGASTQRFLNSNREESSGFTQRQIFTTSVILHIAVGLIVCILLETIGLWFVYNKLVIPENQFDAAVIVYHVSVISCFLSIVTTPYSALINAHEKMGIYAYFSLLDVTLRLLIVFLLLAIDGNKLICYAYLCLGVSFLMCVVYIIYCRRTFSESKLQKFFNYSLIKDMTKFSGWMVWGCIAVIFSNQGVTILINIFCGPVLNASRALAASVQSILYQFSNNILAAGKPQITHEYGEKNRSGLYDLVNLTTKTTFFMMLLPAVPLFFFTNQILALWLTIVPPMTAIFIKILILDMLFRAIYEPIAIVNQAGGNVRLYQLTVTCFYLFQFVGAYAFLSLEFPAYYAYLSILLCTLLGIYPRLKIVQKVDNYDIVNFVKFSMFPIFKVFGIVVLILGILYGLKLYEVDDLWFICLMMLAMVAGLIVIIGFVGLSSDERLIVKSRLQMYLRKT